MIISELLHKLMLPTITSLKRCTIVTAPRLHTVHCPHFVLIVLQSTCVFLLLIQPTQSRKYHHFTQKLVILPSVQKLIMQNLQGAWLIILSILLLGSLDLLSCRVHYIIPSEDHPCNADSCLTLSEFAYNSTSYVDSNTTLFITGGSHNLDKEISMSNVESFYMLSTNGTNSIICNKSANLTFTNIGHIHIYDLTFIGCGSTSISLVNQLTIQQSRFLNSSETSISINGTNANITGTFFLLNTVGTCKQDLKFFKYLQMTSTFSYTRLSSTVRVGGAMMTSHSTITVNNCTFEENSANIGGAIFSELGSNINISNSEFTSNHATTGCTNELSTGGAIFIDGFGTLMIHNSTFENNTSDQDGGMAAIFNASLLISQSIASNNAAVRYGGVVAITSSSAWLGNSHFAYNLAETGGGAISTYESSATIIDSTYSYNSVQNDGGVAHVKNNSIIIISNCTFISNSATNYGGVFYIEINSFLAVNNSTINSNTATYGGYAFTNNSDNVSVSTSTLNYNVAAARGGVMYLIKNSSTTIRNSTFDHNRAEYGGGIISVREFGSSAFIYASNFSDNVVDVFGGVAEVTNGGYMFVNNSIFYNNFAGNDGGVFDGYIMSTIKVYRSNFTNNRARVGGVVSIRQGSEFFVMKCIFHNSSGVDFGAVIHALKETNTTIHNCTFSHNLALFGGVLIVESNNDVTIDNSMFNNNIAEIDGGVVYLRTWCRIIIRNSLFNKNTAGNDGIMIANDNSFVEIENTTFSDNEAGHDGGCLYVNDNSTIIVTGSNLTRNYAGNSGGAVYGLKSSNITIRASRIENNTAQNSGGGIHAQKDSIITIDASNFTSNTADYGGSLRVYVHSKASITGSMFAGSKANIAGGAMAVYEHSILLVYTSNFSYHKATSGGVLEAFQTTFEDNNSQTNTVHMIKCKFWNNSANYGAVVSTEGTRITIKSTLFQQNRAKYIGGGIYAPTLSIINIDISNFTGNIAEDNGGVMHLVGDSIAVVNNSVFTSNMANNRGGVIYLYHSNVSIFNGTFNSSIAGQNGGVVYAILNSFVTIDNSSFKNNTANKDGGAVNSMLDGSVIVQHCSFISNSASSSGGALRLSDDSNAAIIDSIFQLNRAQDHGGAISVSNLSEITIAAGSNFSQNAAEKGAALALEEKSSMAIISCSTSLLTKNNDSERQRMAGGEIEIYNNTATTSGGGIYLKSSYIYLGMETTVSYNQGSVMGGGIHAVDSTINIGNTVHFDSNKAISGGGISLVGSKLSELNKESLMLDVSFVSNYATNYGGAIYVDDKQDTAVCDHSGFDSGNPITIENGCFFQNVTGSLMINFKNNYANCSGHDLFGGLLDRCIVISGINISSLESNGVTHFANISNIGHNFDTISSKPVRVCHCINNRPRCDHKLPSVKVKSGNGFNISVAAVDQVNHPVVATVYSSFVDLNSLSDSQTIYKVGNSCSDLNYLVSFHQAPKEYELTLYADGPCLNTGISKFSIGVHVFSCICPHGFMWSNANSACVCECDKRYKTFATNIQECNSSTESVIRKGRFWITYLNNSDNTSSPYLIYPYCPRDYCQPLTDSISVNLNLPNGSDAQCANNRNGILCGRCKPHYSLSLGSSNCIKCGKHWYGLLAGIIIAAFFAGIILVFLLLMFNITVAVGSMNSIIFYANIVYANRSIYFSAPHSTPIKVFISWLNLEIGIDTCFYEGMDTYFKTWIQLAFPMYIIFLVIMVIWVSSCSIKLSNLLGRRNPVATLATLILLSYTKLLETVIASLSFVSLTYPNGKTMIKWLLDANVEYGKGKHIALICVAILILIVGLLYTIIIFSWQWLLHCQRSVLLKWTRNLKFHSFVSTYHTPHTAKHRYWIGMLLLVRVIVYLISAFSVSVDPRITLLATIVIISCLLVYKAMFMIRVYKNWLLNVLESYVYFNIVIFTSFLWYTFDDRNKEILQTILAYISVGTIFILSLSVIFFHVYRFSSTKIYSLGQKSKFGRIIKALMSKDQDVDYQSLQDDHPLLDAIDTLRENNGYKPSPKSQSEPTSSVVSMTGCAESSIVEYPQPQEGKSGDKASILLQNNDKDDGREQSKRIRSLSGILTFKSRSAESASVTRKSKPKLSSLRVSNKSTMEPLLEEDKL